MTVSAIHEELESVDVPNTSLGLVIFPMSRTPNNNSSVLIGELTNAARAGNGVGAATGAINAVDATLMA